MAFSSMARSLAVLTWRGCRMSWHMYSLMLSNAPASESARAKSARSGFSGRSIVIVDDVVAAFNRPDLTVPERDRLMNLYRRYHGRVLKIPEVGEGIAGSRTPAGKTWFAAGDTTGTR